MPARVTIEAASKAEAQLIAEELSQRVEARSWRGFGVIHLGAKDKTEVRELIESVSRSAQEHGLKWARLRYDDEELVFRANGNGKRI